ncbi:MAG TPA: hypothetical protein VFC07_13650 [Verrucomicrobiae bacterium]|nr:hypothetical protein [Verrucomicrobiae bacterium]
MGNTGTGTANLCPGLTQGTAPHKYLYASIYHPNTLALRWSSWITNAGAVTGDYFLSTTSGSIGS